MRTFFSIAFALLIIPIDLFSVTVYVNSSAQGLNTGNSWQNAYNDLQDALSISPFPDTIWIAEGTYFPTSDSDRYISFDLPSGIVLFGGFQGNETQLSQRDWENHPTILSGDIGNPGVDLDNSFSVLTADGTVSSTTIDGLIIMRGNANSDINLELVYGKTKCGGGLHVNGKGAGNQADIQIINCKFQENKSRISGAAINFSGYGGSTGFVITNCLFENNVSEGSGGAIGKQGGCTTQQLITSCIFENNWAGATGGSYSCYDQNVSIDLQFQNCSFIHNEATLGGAIAKNDFFGVNENDLLIDGCQFEENIATNYGGAIYAEVLFTGEIFINNCQFQMNQAENEGSAIFSEAFEGSNFSISQSSFTQNGSNSEGSLLSLTNYRFTSLNNQFIENQSQQESCFRFHSNQTIDIINNTFFQNKVLSNEGVFKISGGEATFLNSIIWENQANNNHAFFNLSNTNLNIGASIFDISSCDSLIYQEPYSGSSQLSCQADVFFGIHPQFRDPANHNFSVRSCSPAINAGQNSVIIDFDIQEDVNGNERFLDGQVDIGAYEQTAFAANIDSIQDITCKGDANGKVFLNTQGTLPLDIFWAQANETGNNTENLQPGDYTFIISDADACIDTLKVSIEEPAFLQSDHIFVAQIDCPYNMNGRIEIFPTGGIPPYSYLWNNAETSSTVENLAEDTYEITVSDANGCSYVEVILITAPPEIGVDFTIERASSFNVADGSIKLDSIFGGTPGYSYLWSNGETTPSLNYLSPGHYELTITDSNNCDYIYSFTINFTNPINELSFNPVQVFPNPADEFLTISFDYSTNSNSWFFLYNSLGQEIFKTELPFGQKDYEIPIQSIPAGFYSFVLKEENLLFSNGIISIVH